MWTITIIGWGIYGNYANIYIYSIQLYKKTFSNIWYKSVKIKRKILKKIIKPKNRDLIIKWSKKLKLKPNIKYEYSLSIKNMII